MTADKAYDRLRAALLASAPNVKVRQIYAAALERMRDDIVQVFEAALAKRRRTVAALAEDSDRQPDADLWTPRKRETANLAAMRVVASKRPEDFTQADRDIVRAYSGWGGLSIERNEDEFPDGFPIPEERGLIHEYYTPTRVAREVERVLRPYLPTLPTMDGKRVLALEPSAGIGRFVRAFGVEPWQDTLRWQAVEYSALSSRMLAAIRPDVAVYDGPFERWVANQGPSVMGKLGLVVSNPPYGARGEAATIEANRNYAKESSAYAYFLRRAMDLVAKDGIGVFVIPAGFMTGTGKKSSTLRANVLARHHLMGAFRLPSQLFPGAMLVVDLVFLRSRGGEIDVPEEDRYVLEGNYFKVHPEHVLGKERGRESAEDDVTAKPRWGYQVDGEFEALPELVERLQYKPEADEVRAYIPFTAAQLKAWEAEQEAADTSEAMEAAIALGLRVRNYLARKSREPSEARAMHASLIEALRGWVSVYGTVEEGLRGLRAPADVRDAVEAFRNAYERGTGALAPAILTPPEVNDASELAASNSVTTLAEAIFRRTRTCPPIELTAITQRPAQPESQDGQELFRAGWCWDPSLGSYVPGSEYYSGDLYARYDALTGIASKGNPGSLASQALFQQTRLMELIDPTPFLAIENVDASEGWVPDDVISAWLESERRKRNPYSGASIAVAKDPETGLYALLTNGVKQATADLGQRYQKVIGWLNSDENYFRGYASDGVSKGDAERAGKAVAELQAAWRAKTRKEYAQHLQAFLASQPELAAKVADAYNRRFSGWVQPTYEYQPLDLARWDRAAVTLRPWQQNGAKRLCANRGGLLAYDVGVGKTFTGIAVLAQAKQEGWARRPVVIVPKTVVSNWMSEIKKALPDFRVGVIGAKWKLRTTGPKAGMVESTTDTREERQRKYAAFQAGLYDVLLISMPRLGSTDITVDEAMELVGNNQAVMSMFALAAEHGRKKKTERKKATAKERLAEFLAKTLSDTTTDAEVDAEDAQEDGEEGRPKKAKAAMQSDGVAWSDLGVDFVMVDEAQAFKNLFEPPPRDGNIPKFMGSVATSKRAWQLFIRTLEVHRRTKGTGVVLLSATPAKNSPVEFFSMLSYVSASLWERRGLGTVNNFMQRYLEIEPAMVLDAAIQAKMQSAVKGFRNLRELRDIVFRYGEFKTAKDVGLELPEPTVHFVEVEMDPHQTALYDRFGDELEQFVRAGARDPDDPAKVLRLMTMLALIAIHPDLPRDGGWTYKEAQHASFPPASPKLIACAENVVANQTCGHIIFVENVAVHAWLREVLIALGMPAKRIGVMNASTAKQTSERQRLADAFNGRPDDGIAPALDAIICNQVAYEGINLQKRTCAIHHIDLPWEPSTLQQRNGRGVRQGNTLDGVGIYYYFAKRSMDGVRFNLIAGKRGWMTSLLGGEENQTNNPGATVQLGPEEILIMLSRDPEATRALIEEKKEEQRQRAREGKVAAAMQEFTKLSLRVNPRRYVLQDAAELAAADALVENMTKSLENYDPEDWPWASHVRAAVRAGETWRVQAKNAIVWKGMRFHAVNPGLFDSYFDVTIAREGDIWARRDADPFPTQITEAFFLSLPEMHPSMLAPYEGGADAQLEDAVHGWIGRAEAVLEEAERRWMRQQDWAPATPNTAQKWENVTGEFASYAGGYKRESVALTPKLMRAMGDAFWGVAWSRCVAVLSRLLRAFNDARFSRLDGAELDAAAWNEFETFFPAIYDGRPIVLGIHPVKNWDRIELLPPTLDGYHEYVRALAADRKAKVNPLKASVVAYFGRDLPPLTKLHTAPAEELPALVDASKVQAYLEELRSAGLDWEVQVGSGELLQPPEPAQLDKYVDLTRVAGFLGKQGALGEADRETKALLDAALPVLDQYLLPALGTGQEIVEGTSRQDDGVPFAFLVAEAEEEERVPNPYGRPVRTLDDVERVTHAAAVDGLSPQLEAKLIAAKAVLEGTRPTWANRRQRERLHDLVEYHLRSAGRSPRKANPRQQWVGMDTSYILVDATMGTVVANLTEDDVARIRRSGVPRSLRDFDGSAYSDDLIGMQVSVEQVLEAAPTPAAPARRPHQAKGR